MSRLLVVTWLVALVALTGLEWLFTGDKGNVTDPRLWVVGVRMIVMGYMAYLAASEAGAISRTWLGVTTAFWLVLITMYFVYFWGNTAGWYYGFLPLFNRYLFWIFALWAALVLARRQLLTEADLARVGAAIVLFTAGLMLWRWRSGTLMTGVLGRDLASSDPEADTLINAAYQVLAGMLLLLAGGRRRGSWNIVLALGGFGLLVLLGKRGAFVAGAFALAAMVFASWRLRLIAAWKLGLFCLAGGLLLCVLAVRFSFEIEQRLEDLSDPDKMGSNRGIMYRSLIENWGRYEPHEQLFGRGYEASVEVLGGDRGALAHSDWLELLVDYGLVGVIWFLLFHGIVVYRILLLFRFQDSRAVGLLTWWAAFVPVTVYSFTLTGYNTAFYALVLGVAFGRPVLERYSKGSSAGVGMSGAAHRIAQRRN